MYEECVARGVKNEDYQVDGFELWVLDGNSYIFNMLNTSLYLVLHNV